MLHAFRRSFIPVALALLLMAVAAPAGLAAPNPSGQGQPNANCETSTTEASGFSTSGFANAQAVYAGAGESAEGPANSLAVSQYDVACFQLSNPH